VVKSMTCKTNFHPTCQHVIHPNKTHKKPNIAMTLNTAECYAARQPGSLAAAHKEWSFKNPSMLAKQGYGLLARMTGMQEASRSAHGAPSRFAESLASIIGLPCRCCPYWKSTGTGWVHDHKPPEDERKKGEHTGRAKFS
jgi:hypothetical protein